MKYFSKGLSKLFVLYEFWTCFFQMPVDAGGT